jgi:hypothetical protein
VLWYVSPQILYFLSSDSRYLSVQQSSKRSGTSVKLDWLPSPSFISISVTLESKISAAYFLPSSSNSPVDPTISVKSSLNCIQTTIVVPNNPERIDLWDA